MSFLLALTLAQAAAVAPVPTDEVVAKPKKRCELVSEIGSIRKRRVCTTESQSSEAARERRENARRILDQDHRDRQLVQDNYGEKPLP